MVHTPLVVLSHLLVTNTYFTLPSSHSDSCLAHAPQYVAPGGRTIYFTDKSCIDTLPSDLLEFPQALVRQVKAPQYDTSRLLWVERQEVEYVSPVAKEGYKFVWGELDQFFQRVHSMEDASLGSVESQQEVLQSHAIESHVVYEAQMLAQGPKYGLIAIHPSLIPIYDSLLPAHWRGSLLPESLTNAATIPVPSNAVKRVQHILDNFKFDPVVASLVHNISVPQMKNDIRFLTGEDGKSGIVSRHSFSSGIRVAAEWIKERIEETGATCELKPFLPGFGPNVIWCALTFVFSWLVSSSGGQHQQVPRDSQQH